MKQNLVVFDLDDTLYNEIDFLKSAFIYISKIVDQKNLNLFEEMMAKFHKNKDVFEFISKKYQFQKTELINLYRNHFPIGLPSTIDLTKFLTNFKNENIILGLITDGRSLTQRNKLKALKIETLFDKIIISEEFGSEKPSLENFYAFDEYKNYEKIYVADNTKKDFFAPNKLGWKTICLLDNGRNIHNQNFNLTKDYLPKTIIKSLLELNQIIIK